MSYEELIDWLYGTQMFGVKLGLESTTRLLEGRGLLPLPPELRVVHVAGTNGKGSVCAFAERILRDAGFCTGLFTSPHLVSFCERIRMRGERIPEEAVVRILSGIREEVEAWETHPTFFEISLALAMEHFRDEGCDRLVLETGMGGRLDATNAVPSHVSLITPIGMDHEAWLGDTLRAIAGEKAGILKPGTPAVIAKLAPEAREVVGRRALELGIPCIEAHPVPEDWPLGLRGPHQRENAALAVEAACRVGGDRLSEEGIRASLAATHWPGRFQECGEGLFLDGAHNPAAAIVLRQAWEDACPGEKAQLVFGAIESKDIRGVFAALLPVLGSLALVPVNSARRIPVAEMRRAFEEACDGELPIPIAECATLQEALAKAKTRAASEGGRVLVAGSLYLVGEALALLEGGDFEPSLQ